MGALSFSDRARRSMWRMLPKRALSGAIGWGAKRPLPVSVRVGMLTRFARAYGIDIDEAERPLVEYPGFDEFFTRRLRPEARPIADGLRTIVSPADGTVVECGLATDGKMIQAKGDVFDLAELVGDADVAFRLKGGAYLITYLSPKDYHRVHAPVAGKVIGWRHIPGSLFSVGARSVRTEPGLFTRNERLVTLVEMHHGGLCAVVMVAAVGVGHVTVSYDPDVATHGATFRRAAVSHRRYERPISVARGAELGIFHLGSTTIVVFEAGHAELDTFAAGTSTKMGVAIGQEVHPAGSGPGARA
jgi:phosphatidylserine decarboxylase